MSEIQASSSRTCFRIDEEIQQRIADPRDQNFANNSRFFSDDLFLSHFSLLIGQAYDILLSWFELNIAALAFPLPDLIQLLYSFLCDPQRGSSL